MQQLFTAFVFFLLSIPALMAQQYSRSGWAAPQESQSQLRRFPCGGLTVADEPFDSETLPVDWLSLDGDNLLPADEIQFLFPSGGWQPIIDFKDSTNRALASPSWYQDTVGTSNDWLVSPLMTNLPSNVCLSWYAYSQDVFFPESYEIRVSTTTPDEAGFLAEPAVLSVAEEGYDLNYRSTSLAAYAGQDIYIAFRHTTTDGFALVLDNVRLAQVETLDLALYQVPEVATDTGDQYFFTGAIINYGLDTVVLDSNQLTISYQIDEEAIQTITLADSFGFLPNDTIQFRHDSAWVPTENKVYRVRLWIAGFGVDDVPTNDSIGRWQGVGTTTALEPQKEGLPLSVYPNPTQDQLQIVWQGAGVPRLSISLLDLTGRPVLPPQNNIGQTHQLSLANLPKGMYLLRVVNADGVSRVERIIKL